MTYYETVEGLAILSSEGDLIPCPIWVPSDGPSGHVRERLEHIDLMCPVQVISPTGSHVWVRTDTPLHGFGFGLYTCIMQANVRNLPATKENHEY